ncbi:MAG: hypothetical protein Hyperionvirus33_17 [Hyperionvirus sp.]|uniref:Uncharacterized protein n=1 Tax=Hyperionvirus sp. TaxID=2487770 RepID=A0A3G5ADI1_9VIRU|nr:MAG: hypothetical protein Hyperionvirus33_17 [Hyperionvirus sp.]
MKKNHCGINVNIGRSTRLSYDDCAYEDKLEESVAPLQYRMDANSIFNCDGCFAPFGPRSAYGVSMPVENEPGVSQRAELVNIESILTNRNLLNSSCKKNEVNPIDITQFKLKNPRVCKQFISPLSSRLSDPSANYRDLSINRFYDLNKNPQANIFWDFATNTTLEARDNYVAEIPRQWCNKRSFPRTEEGCPKDKTIQIKTPCVD